MRHGGEVCGKYHIKSDFSVNLNPLGVPGSILRYLEQAEDELMKYPDQDCTGLRHKIAEADGIDEREIVCGNGASELIDLVLRASETERVLLPVPTFTGYERALENIGAEVERYRLTAEKGFILPEAFADEIERSAGKGGTLMLILCNPNNPTGRMIKPELLKEISEICEKKKIRLLLDECYLGMLNGGMKRSLRTSVKKLRHLIVLDAFTKKYAMPGLRLGYLISGDPALLDRVRALQAEWSVSTLAQKAGILALQEREWLREAGILIESERGYLAEALRESGFTVYDSEAGFLMFQTDKELMEPLLEQGFLIRSCENIPGLNGSFYRIAVKRHEENEELMRAIRRSL